MILRELFNRFKANPEEFYKYSVYSYCTQCTVYCV